MTKLHGNLGTDRRDHVTFESRVKARHAALLAIAAVGLAVAPRARSQESLQAAAPAAPAPLLARAAMSGRFAFTGGPTEAARIERAISRAVEGLLFVIRPIAADKLRGENPLYRTLDIAVASSPTDSRESVSVQYNERRVVTTNGQVVRVISHTSEPLDARHEWLPRGFAHIFDLRADQGGIKRNDFAYAADGNSFELRVLLESSRMSAPLRYRLSYQRVR